MRPPHDGGNRHFCFTSAHRPRTEAVTANDNHVHRSIGRRLRDLRTSSGQSQQQLAEKLQIDPQDIAGFESGALRLSADRLLRIADALGVRAIEFLRFSDEAQRGAGDAENQFYEEGSAYVSLIDEGLALHRAFISIKAKSLRREIVDLAIEYGRMESIN